MLYRSRFTTCAAMLQRPAVVVVGLPLVVARQCYCHQLRGLPLSPALLRRPLVVRQTSTTAAVLETAASRRAKRRQAAEAPPTTEERLVALKSAEKKIAGFALGSLIVGFITLKLAFASVTPKDHSLKEEEKNSSTTTGSGTGSRMASSTPRPLVLTGPSGSGKSTLLKKLFADFPDTFGFSVSHTTRNPRSGEKDGREYHFTSKEEMKKSIDEGGFIEWAEFSGNMYGTSKQAVRDVQATGRICVLDIDIQGVRSMKKTDLNPLYVFISPPSVKELEERLRKRQTESEESLRKRLDRAKTEMKEAEQEDLFDHTVVNDELDKAYQTLKATVVKEMGIKDTTT